MCRYHNYQKLSSHFRLSRRRCRQQCFIYQGRESSDLAHLHSELTSRRLPLLWDDITPARKHLLTATISDILPDRRPLRYSKPLRELTFPLGRHLIYFPPVTPLSSLLPDGTDPGQSPGPPFVRRMWAGGSMTLYQPWSSRAVSHRQITCLERITDVTIKGLVGDEKVFVTTNRRIGNFDLKETPWETEEVIRSKLIRDKHCVMDETRNLVFQREKKGQDAADAIKKQPKLLKPIHEPTFSHKITPSALLLFRFSAMTFNAHRIHLDKQYCIETEGHRNLLVHGPLSLLLMLEVLKSHLHSLGLGTTVQHVEYRNLAPLYAEEEMTICGRPRDDTKWDVWIEGKDGGYAVKGVADVLKVVPKDNIVRYTPYSKKLKNLLLAKRLDKGNLRINHV